MTWANRITLARIAAFPLMLACLMEYYISGVEKWRMAAFWIFLLAALSDALDGYLAKHWGQRTELGAFLDPMADKLLQLGGLLALTFIPFPMLPRIPLWLTVLILAKDVLLVSGYLRLRQLQGHVYVRPHWTGKIATAFVFLLIGSDLLRWEALFCASIVIIALTIVLSTGHYLVEGLEHYRTAKAVK